jgi:hypothetical protein
MKIYKTTIITADLYGCQNFISHVKRRKRLRMFQNTMLRRIFGPKRDEMARGCRKLHNEELHNLYYSPYITY